MAEIIDIDLVTHSEVDIAASAARIWPHILEPNPWKQGLQPTHQSGPVNGIGERRIAYDQDGVTAVLTIDTVALVVNARKTIKITTSFAPVSWASWILAEHNGVTTVSYDVYGVMSTPVDALKDSGLNAADYVAMNQRRFDAELLSLRDVVLGQPAD